MLALVNQHQQPSVRDRVTTNCVACNTQRIVVYRELIRAANRQSQYVTSCLCQQCFKSLPEFSSTIGKKISDSLANRTHESKIAHAQKLKDLWDNDAYRSKCTNKHSTTTKQLISQKIVAKFNDHNYAAKISAARRAYWEDEDYRLSRTWNNERFISEATAIHGDKYDYSLVVYDGFKNKVAIRCHTHGIFHQLPGHHIYFGNGCPTCANNQTASVPENALASWLVSIGESVTRNDRSMLGGAELDIFIPNRKLAIEYHGLYWHSYASNETGPQRYRHHFKRTLADRNQIRLLQFYEDEWRDRQDIVKSMILNRIGLSTRIFARKCTINTLNTTVAKDFFDANHLYGHRDAKHIIGLTYGGEVVAAISLSGHCDGGYEVIRFANKTFHTVVGGFSRLINYVKSVVGATRIFTYVDRRYGDATSHIATGFSLNGITPPGYRYTKNGISYSRIKFQKHKLARLLPVYDASKSEADNMFANGYRRLWDAGHYRLEWTI